MTLEQGIAAVREAGIEVDASRAAYWMESGEAQTTVDAIAGAVDASEALEALRVLAAM